MRVIVIAGSQKRERVHEASAHESFDNVEAQGVTIERGIHLKLAASVAVTASLSACSGKGRDSAASCRICPTSRCASAWSPNRWATASSMPSRKVATKRLRNSATSK